MSSCSLVLDVQLFTMSLCSPGVVSELILVVLFKMHTASEWTLVFRY